MYYFISLLSLSRSFNVKDFYYNKFYIFLKYLYTYLAYLLNVNFYNLKASNYF